MSDPPTVELSGPEATLEAIRQRIAAGEPLTGDLARGFYRAVAAVDPAATEDSLAALPGNSGAHLYRSLVGWAALVQRERVLDLGCGSGGAARIAAEAVGPEGTVIGVDPSPEALEVARARTPDELPVLYRPGTAENISTIPDRSIDCVIASLVLEQITDLPAAAAEIFRVLRPGGRLVASVMDFDQLRPMDAAFMGAVIAVVARRAPGALAGRASRASIPREPTDLHAFKSAGLASFEERDAQLAAALETPDDAAAFFGRSLIGHAIGPEGQAEMREVLEWRVPHTLYLPMRFLRTRRPG
jgi:SAM-dependent methyltransferase